MIPGFLLNLVALLPGASPLSLVYEAVAGNESFSLPLVNILAAAVVGSALFFLWGWWSAAVAPALCAAWCVAGGLLDRGRRESRSRMRGCRDANGTRRAVSP